MKLTKTIVGLLILFNVNSTLLAQTSKKSKKKSYGKYDGASCISAKVFAIQQLTNYKCRSVGFGHRHI